MRRVGWSLVWKKKNARLVWIQYVLLAALAVATAVTVYFALTKGGAQTLFPEHTGVQPGMRPQP